MVERVVRGSECINNLKETGMQLQCPILSNALGPKSRGTCGYIFCLKERKRILKKLYKRYDPVLNRSWDE